MEMEIVRGRRAPYTQVADWVVLSHVSRSAKLLYQVLAAHVNQTRGDGTAWPTRAVLADLLDYAKPSSVDPMIVELEKLEAIDVKRGRRHPQHGGPISNLYVIHETPPPGYSGHVSLGDYYATRRGGSPSQGTTQAPDRGGVVPPRGLGVVPPRGLGVVPPRGLKQEEVERDEVERDETQTPTRAKRAGGEFAAVADQHFPEWYAAYPKRVGKIAARKAYEKALGLLAADDRVRSGQSTAVDILLCAAHSYATERRGQDPQYTPQPAVWLNQGRWDDERGPAYQPPAAAGQSTLVERNGMHVTARNAASLDLLEKLRREEAAAATQDIALHNLTEGSPW